MAKRKPKTKTKASTTKRSAVKHRKLSPEFLGLVLAIISIIGLLRLGVVGRIIQFSIATVVGQLYWVALLALTGYSLVKIVKGNKLKLNARYSYAALCFFIASIIILQYTVNRQFQVNWDNSFSSTWSAVRNMWTARTVLPSVGTGVLGALLFQGMSWLIAPLGSLMMATVIVLVGVLLTVGISWQELIAAVKKMFSSSQSNDSDHGRSKNKAQAENGVLTKLNRSLKSLLSSSDDVEPITPDKSEKDSAIDEDEANLGNYGQPLDNPQHSKAQVSGFPLGTTVDNNGEVISPTALNAIEKLKQDREAYQKALSQKNENGPGNDHPLSKGTIDDVFNLGSPSGETNETNEADDDDGKEVNITLSTQLKNINYKLPGLDLLNPPVVSDQTGEYDIIEHNILKLEETFKSFGVDATVVNANLGPAVTKFEIKPAVGVKVNKIVHLSDDIALALAAKDIRIEAPIPGKPYVGIEVPNQSINMVSFREVVETALKSPEPLDIPLGRDVSGNTILANLSKMPHLLIAGATGSGKSVCINGIITSILMKAKPNEVKLMMIDPKKVELNVYNDIPHLLTPVVTNPRKAAQALNKVVEEMERRYELFAASGARNMKSYNEEAKAYEAESGEEQEILPYIVVIVDELADLMMVASNEVEAAIIRLAQMARAAGIHMVLATQRPSVDVITGIIKANVPSRIAFSVSSGTDSRTIIDSNGAEKLLGRGDMLYLPMGESKPIRVQGAFLSDQEVERIVDFVKKQEEVSYVEEMNPNQPTETTTSEPEDELYPEVLEMVSGQETASISMIQRKFRIGYNRAARLIDSLEAHGVVGPQDGSKPRKVLIRSDEISD